MLRFASIVPVLRVADVERCMVWYREILGFSVDPFPAAAPYEFCILRRDAAEVMLRRTRTSSPRTPTAHDWDVYLRLEGGELTALLDHARRRTPLVRGPELMPYGQIEFELEDPEGHRICVAEVLDVKGFPRAVD
jgi:catechol 2,3-dioxygenase-like lactoylglutathione lyase family enzyme